MAQQHRAAGTVTTGLTGLFAVAGVAGVFALATVSPLLSGVVGGAGVAGFLAWTAVRAVSAPAAVRASVPGAASPPRRPVTPTETPPAAHVPAPVPTVDPSERTRTRWAEATARHDEVLHAYAQWELDPRMLLSFPALWDYALPETQEFFAALERAGQLRTVVVPGGPSAPDAEAVETFDGVSRRLRRAWAVAEQTARRTGRDRLSDPLHRDADRALKLLNHADGSSTDAEAASYLTQASTIVHRLAERGVIPNRTRAELELEKRRARALEAGRGGSAQA